MVERWGMSAKIGFLAVAPRDGQGRWPGAEPVSEATQGLVDAEVRRIVDEEREHVRQLLTRQPRASWTRWRKHCWSADARREDAYAAAGISREREPASA